MPLAKNDNPPAGSRGIDWNWSFALKGYLGGHPRPADQTATVHDPAEADQRGEEHHQ
jgi:hypothetical protein